MSNATQTAKQTDTNASTENKPGIFRRGLNSISNFEQDVSHSHPIMTHVATTAAMAGAAKLAAPVVAKGVDGVKKIFGGAARKAGEEVTNEVAKEGAKNFLGGGGGITKLFRRR